MAEEEDFALEDEAAAAAEEGEDYEEGEDGEEEEGGAVVDMGLDDESTAAASSALLMSAATTPSEAKAAALRRTRSFESLSADRLAKEVAKNVQDVCDVTGVPPDVAVILLRHWKWNKEKLLEAFVDEPEKVFKGAGMSGPEVEKKIASSEQTFNCMICLEKQRFNDALALGCGHNYCAGCWRGYLMNKVSEGIMSSLTAKCPHPKCSAPVPESMFSRLLPTAELRTRFEQFSLRSFVDQNPHVKSCPYPGCQCVTRVDRVNRKEPVTCTSCGYTYCFHCNDFDIGDHRPCPCAQVESWQAKAADESENIKWLIANTKRCPQCRSPIEKNGGCMHMTCRKTAGGCGHEFCWLCRGPWTEHGSATGGFYSCNKYDQSTAKNDDMKAAEAKSDLEHYMFYYHRFDSHKRARKIAEEQQKGVGAREEGIAKKFDIRTTDTKFLAEAVEMVIQCRKVLEYSYVYGFHLPKTCKERLLFEYLQEDVEKYTNHLSTLFEMPLDKIVDYHQFVSWREDVSNYTRVTMKFLENFSQGVATGLTSVPDH
jgi:ariadne-1